MKLVVALALVAMVAARPDDYSKFEDINEDEIIDNERLFLAYLDCFIGIGKCTAQANELKELIPEGIQTSCAKCTEKEKPKVAKVIFVARESYPEKWNKLNAIHNADGKYNEVLEEFLKTYHH